MKMLNRQVLLAKWKLIIIWLHRKMKMLIGKARLRYNTYIYIYGAICAFLLDINKNKHLYSAKSYLYCGDIN